MVLKPSFRRLPPPPVVSLTGSRSHVAHCHNLTDRRLRSRGSIVRIGHISSGDRKVVIEDRGVISLHVQLDQRLACSDIAEFQSELDHSVEGMSVNSGKQLIRILVLPFSLPRRLPSNRLRAPYTLVSWSGQQHPFSRPYCAAQHGGYLPKACEDACTR